MPERSSSGMTPQQRRALLAAIAASMIVAAALWWLLLRFLPEPANLLPIQTAVGCIAVAALLTLFAGIEAIAGNFGNVAPIGERRNARTTELENNPR